jgi:hypothetical protein
LSRLVGTFAYCGSTQATRIEPIAALLPVAVVVPSLDWSCTVTGEVPSAASIAAYLRDAALTGSSMWSVVNVLRHWSNLGVDLPTLEQALATARRSTPAKEALFEAYEHGIRTLL